MFLFELWMLLAVSASIFESNEAKDPCLHRVCHCKKMPAEESDTTTQDWVTKGWLEYEPPTWSTTIELGDDISVSCFTAPTDTHDTILDLLNVKRVQEICNEPTAVRDVECEDKIIVNTSITYPNWPKPQSIGLTISAQGEKLPFSAAVSNKALNNLMQLIEELHIDGCDIASMDFLQFSHHLKSLKLTNVNFIGTQEAANNIRQHLNQVPLHALSLDYSQSMANIVMTSSLQFQRLTTLSLKNTTVQDLKVFQGWNTGSSIDLKVLDLSENPLDCSPINWSWLNMAKNNVQVFGKCAVPEEVRGMILTDGVDVLKTGYTTEDYQYAGETQFEEAMLQTDENNVRSTTPRTKMSPSSAHSKESVGTATTVVVATSAVAVVLLISTVVYIVFKYISRKGSANINDGQQDATDDKETDPRFIDLKHLRV